MSVTAKRLLLSALAALLYLPIPLMAAWPGAAPWLSQRFGGLPLSILVGLFLIVAFVALAWMYADQSADRAEAR